MIMTLPTTSLVDRSYTRTADYHIELATASQQRIQLRKVNLDDLTTYKEFDDWKKKLKKEGEIVYLLYCSDGIVALLIEN